MTHGELQTGKSINFGPTPSEIPAGPEINVLSDPRILQSGLATVIGRYGDRKIEGGPWLTPETMIMIGEGDDAQTTTVFAGADQSDIRRNVIYVKDTSGQVFELVVISGAKETTIADGRGRLLETDKDHNKVKSILDSIKTNYGQDVKSLVDDFDIAQYHILELSKTIATKKAELKELEREQHRADLDHEYNNTFKITIVNAWEREGGQSLERVIEAASVSAALEEAMTIFKTINNRSDVQASHYSVSTLMGDGKFFTIPNEVIRPLFRALSEWDKESYTRRKLENQNKNTDGA